MKKISRFWYYLALAFATGCSTPTTHFDGAKQVAVPVREPASFWASIANDSNVPDQSRRTCIMELFRRHVRAGMTLGAVAECLNKPNWLRDDNIWYSGNGGVPVKVDPGDSVFCICIAPDGLVSREKDGSAYVYVSVAGYISADDFRRALHGQPAENQVQEKKLRGIGFLED